MGKYQRLVLITYQTLGEHDNNKKLKYKFLEKSGQDFV